MCVSVYIGRGEQEMLGGEREGRGRDTQPQQRHQSTKAPQQHRTSMSKKYRMVRSHRQQGPLEPHPVPSHIGKCSTWIAAH